MTEKANFPALRFKGFTDPWEQRELGEIAKRVTRRNDHLESQIPLTISAQFGLIRQDEFFDKRIASANLRNYYLLRQGELAYNKSTSNDAPWGTVKQLTKYESGAVSTLYIVFGLSDRSQSDPSFLTSYYESTKWYFEVSNIAAEGARNHGLLNITPDDFFKTTLTIPRSRFEQRKIGLLFDFLNKALSLHQRKCEKLQSLKKALLEKMFPSGSSLVPALRLKGFTDPWEQRELSQLCLPVNRKAPIDSTAPIMMISSTAGFVDQSTHYQISNAGSSLQNYTFLKQGELSYNHGYSKLRNFGSVFTLRVKEARIPFVYHSFSMPNDEPIFFGHYLNCGIFDKDLRRVISSTARMDGLMNISYEEYMSLKVMRPSFSEQKKIGLVLDLLDSAIVLHQRECEKLQNLKKALLEKMFA